MASLLDKFKRGLAKTKSGLFDEIVNLVQNQYVVDDDFLERVEEILIASDIGVETSLAIVDDLKEHVNRAGFNQSGELIDFLKSRLAARLLENTGEKQAPHDFFVPDVKPFVIMVVGVNGAGKTTTIAKLAKGFQTHGKKVLLAAADTFRAAASEQLEIWAQRVNAAIVKTQHGGDPAAIAFDASKAALARDVDVLIVDTAGRLHTKANLMEELKKIERVLGKAIPGSPQEVMLILDASTGQNAIVQARQFKAAVGVTSVAVTKLDGTAKGGMVLAIGHELNLPIRFVGLGEAVDDLKPFEAQTFVEALFE